jgi:hypothetical protein
MPPRSRRVRDALTRFVTDDDLDLWLLSGAAAVFTVLGITGVAGPALLSSAVLAFLALLASSQIRSRRFVEEVARARRVDPTAILRSEFPEDLPERRDAARDVLLIGVALSRTIQTYREPLRTALRAGARVRIIVLDPEIHDVLRGLATPGGGGKVSRARQRILNSLDELTYLQETIGGALEIRVSSTIPPAGVNALDTGTAHGLLVVQHYEFGATTEPSPIMVLGPADGYWYQHFRAEAERFWAAGRPWPTTAGRPAVTAHPSFVDQFGPELVEAISSADDVLITGVTRSQLLISHFKVFELLLRRGVPLRILLLSPTSPTLDRAAARHYSERSGEALGARISNSRRLITSLAEITGGPVELRHTEHLLSLGTVAVNVAGGRRDETSRLFLSHFLNRGDTEPKFVLSTGEPGPFEAFAQEAEGLWEAGAAVRLG